jgi:hypothetical protein
MSPDRSTAECLFEDTGAPSQSSLPHFFLDRDGDDDPEVRRLQEMLQRKMPAIRGLLQRLLRNDSDLPEYMDRIYRRLRGALLSDANLDDAAVWRRAVSVVHEDRRRSWRRKFVRIKPSGVDLSDPTSLNFYIALVRADQLAAFRACLDEWTREAFDLKYSSSVELSGEEMARRFGIARAAFYQRWKRGMDAGREEYRRRHGDPMP